LPWIYYDRFMCQEFWLDLKVIRYSLCQQTQDYQSFLRVFPFVPTSSNSVSLISLVCCIWPPKDVPKFPRSIFDPQEKSGGSCWEDLWLHQKSGMRISSVCWLCCRRFGRSSWPCMGSGHALARITGCRVPRYQQYNHNTSSATAQGPCTRMSHRKSSFSRVLPSGLTTRNHRVLCHNSYWAASSLARKYVRDLEWMSTFKSRWTRFRSCMYFIAWSVW